MSENLIAYCEFKKLQKYFKIHLYAGIVRCVVSQPAQRQRLNCTIYVETERIIGHLMHTNACQYCQYNTRTSLCIELHSCFSLFTILCKTLTLPLNRTYTQGRNHVEKSSLESLGAPVAEGAVYLKGRL